MKRKKVRNPIARDLRTPKYKKRVEQRKDKILPRKQKYKLTFDEK